MRSILKKNIGLLLFLFITLMIMPQAGWAQMQDPSMQAGQLEVTDEELTRFVQAQNQVIGLQQEYQAILSDVDDPAEQQKIIEEGNEKLVAAIRAQNLDVEKYNTILTALRTDTALQQRISALMQNRQ